MKTRYFFIAIFATLLICSTILLFGCDNTIQNSVSYFTITYKSTEGGYVAGNTNQTIESGQSGSEVTAIALMSVYIFEGWSDGVKEATRKEENVIESQEIKALFRLRDIVVEYIADEGGKIEGDSLQIGDYNTLFSAKAVPNEGYKFKCWSDGENSAIRYDAALLKDKQVTAYFEKITRTFILNYNMVTEDQLSEIELTYWETDKVKLPVPTKDKFTFCGWYRSSWERYDLQVTDKNGNIIAKDAELFKEEDYSYYNPLNRLYAKWEANEKFAYTYKILMIYVTDVQATLPTQKNGKPAQEKVDVNYQISDIERQVYHNLTIKLEETLEELLDGLVDFQIDEYFTTQPMGTDCFIQDSGGDVDLSFRNNVEITQEMLQQYQSVLTTLNFNDYNYTFHSSSGSATIKYGTIYFESDIQFIDIESLLNLSSRYWKSSVINVYVHELAHTIEMRKDYYSFHSAAITYLSHQKDMLELDSYKLYFLSEIELDGRRVGIPYEFWRDDEIS